MAADLARYKDYDYGKMKMLLVCFDRRFYPAVSSNRSLGWSSTSWISPGSTSTTATMTTAARPMIRVCCSRS